VALPPPKGCQLAVNKHPPSLPFPPSSVLIRGPKGALFVGTEFWKHCKGTHVHTGAGDAAPADSAGAESAQPATSAGGPSPHSQAPETAAPGAADSPGVQTDAEGTPLAHWPPLIQPAAPLPPCVTSPDSPSRPFPSSLALGPPAISLPLPSGDTVYPPAAKGAYGSWEGGLCPRVDSETVDPSLCLSPVSDAACWAQLLLAEETSFAFGKHRHYRVVLQRSFQCTAYSVHFTVYIVQLTAWPAGPSSCSRRRPPLPLVSITGRVTGITLQLSAHSAQRTAHSVQRTVYSTA